MQEVRTCCIMGDHLLRLPFELNEGKLYGIKLKNTLRAQIVRLIEENAVTHFITSMALGIEQYAAEIVLDLKNIYPSITLECVIPFETQAALWTKAQRDKYYYIIENCDKETLLQYHYTHDCMKQCNEYLVKQSQFIMAVWNGRYGQIERTIVYARSLLKKIYIIDPVTLKISTDIQTFKKFLSISAEF